MYENISKLLPNAIPVIHEYTIHAHLNTHTSNPITCVAASI